MKSSLPFLVTVLALLNLTSCGAGGENATTTKSNNEAPYAIKLNEAEGNKKAVLLSDFAKSITYLALESEVEHLIANNPFFYLSEDYIFSTAFRQIYVFNRANGKFERQISSYGDGPDQYHNTVPQVHIDEKEEVVYVVNPRGNTVGLNTSGIEKVKFNKPSEDSTFTGTFRSLGKGTYVGFHSNYDCNQSLKLVVFDENGRMLKGYTNNVPCINEHPDRISFNSSEGSFYGWDEKVFFKENFNDTLYQVNKDSLSFKAVFVNEENSLPYAKKTSLITKEEMAPFFLISKLDETDDFIFFNFRYKERNHSAYYDKLIDVTRVAYTKDTELNYFTNDLDNFIPFNPSYATEDGKLVGYLEAPYVLEWFETNPEKAARLPPELKKLENIQEDDNPILMIVDTKD